MRRDLACLPAALLSMAALPVEARPVGTLSHDARNGGYTRGGLFPQAYPTPFSQGGSCAAWCVADVSPCDPDYYKVADRRCNVSQNGLFPK